MNAQEARKRALEITGSAEKTQYAEIQNKIGVAVDDGKMECHYYNSVMPAVSVRLASEGYKISSYFDQREGTTVTITW